jgi:hypothetical protein
MDFATEGYGGDVGRMRVRDSEPGTERRLVYQYSLTSGNGRFDAAQASRFCTESNSPLIARFVPASAADRRKATGPSGTGPVSVEPETVAVTALKVADGDGAPSLIVRLREMQGRAGKASVTAKLPLRRAAMTSLLEVPTSAPVRVEGNTAEVQLAPHGVATLRLDFGTVK